MLNSIIDQHLDFNKDKELVITKILFLGKNFNDANVTICIQFHMQTNGAVISPTKIKSFHSARTSGY